MTEFIIGVSLGVALVLAVFVILAQFAALRARNKDVKELADKLTEMSEAKARFEDTAVKTILREQQQNSRPLVTDDTARLLAKVLYDYIRPYLELHTPPAGGYKN